jgi:hypothetical protein
VAAVTLSSWEVLGIGGIGIKNLGRRIDATAAVDPDARDLMMRGYAL